jgi:hypothetical protein
MTPNVCFALLDAAVIGGRGEDPVVDKMTHARLLEEAAALGGVLRHLGVGVGSPVVIDLEDDLDAVVAALASARIGAVVTTRENPAAPVVLTSKASAGGPSGQTRVVRGEDVHEPDLEWGLMMRAGRTDPAAAEVLDPVSAYSPQRSVAEQIEVLARSAPPYDAAGLRWVLQV